MTIRCVADRAATRQNSRRSTAHRSYPQEVFHRVLLWTFVVPPLVGLLFVAVFRRKPAWTALTLAAALFLFTLIAVACLKLSQRGQLPRAARLYLTSVLLVVALFLLFIPEALILPGVIVLFILMLLAMAVEPFGRALGWGAVMALLYLVTLALRRVLDVPPMDFGPWGDLFRFSLPVIELVIFIVLMRAVTQHLNEALAQSQLAEAGLLQLAAIVENSDDAILSKTLEGTILSWNQGAERLYGYSAEEIRGRSVSILVPPDRQDELEQMTERLKRGERVEQCETVRVRKDGQQIHVSVTVSPIHDATGRVISVSTIERDIMERKRMEEELLHLSTHDGLTGLFNRSYFEAELDRLKRGREFPVNVVLVDVDGLKWVNDSQGHAAGDELLRRAAAVLQSSFRAEDAVARIGGDEFGVLLPSADERVAEGLAQRVRHNLGLHNRGGEAERLSLSLGTATAEKGERLVEAIRQADERLYHDKSNHRQHRLGREYQSTASRGLATNYPSES